MSQTKFFFYDLLTKLKPRQSFDWNTILTELLTETQKKQIHYELVEEYTLSIHIIKKESLQDKTIIYEGYMVVGENGEDYKKEKKGDFLELGFEEDEHLTHTYKGKLYFLFIIKPDGKIMLMLEKCYFSINIKGFLTYFKNRYSDKLEEIKSRNKLGKDLINTIKSLKDNKVTLVRIYFKKYTPLETIRTFGYVEEEIASLTEKGIRANLVLQWDGDLTVENFFKTFFRRDTFEEALDVDFGEFLKIFSFGTDHDVITDLNLLDQIICFTLPLDKSNYDDVHLFLAMKDFYEANKNKLQ